MAKVSAQAAATLVVLGASRQPRDADAQTLSTVLALRALPSAPKSSLIAELRLSQSTHVFTRLGGERNLVPILAATVVDAALVQCALVPAVGAITLDLLSFEGNNVELLEASAAGCAGWRFEHVRRHFAAATAIGVAPSGSASIVLGPPDDRIVERGDQVILIAEDQMALAATTRENETTSKVVPLAAAFRKAAVGSEKTGRLDVADAPRVDVALIGWNDRVVPMLRELDRHVAQGSVVHVLSERRTEHRRRYLKEEGLQMDGTTAEREPSRHDEAAPTTGVPPPRRRACQRCKNDPTP